MMKATLKKYAKELLAMLRGNVRHYDAPEEPVGESNWKSLQYGEDLSCVFWYL